MGAAAAVVVIAGVAGIRSLDLVAMPAPPDLEPAADLLDAGGLGHVRLGMSWPEVGGANLTPSGEEDRYGCRRYEMDPDRFPPAPTTWLWMREWSVVGVGVAHEGWSGSDVPFRTWTGLASGARLAPGVPELHRWDVDRSAPVAVHRFVHDGVTTTLADTTGDGRLDYATVDSAAGEACRLTRDAVDEAMPGPPGTGTPMIDWESGTVSAGSARVGSPVSDLESDLDEGWIAMPPVAAPGFEPPDCRVYVTIRETGLSATVRGDRIVGVTAAGISGGPVTGMTETEATAALRDIVPAPPVRSVSATNPAAVQLTIADAPGGPLTVNLLHPPAIVDGLDVPVTAPSWLAPAVVSSVSSGEPACPPSGVTPEAR